MAQPNLSERKDVRRLEKLAAVAIAARVSYTKRIMSDYAGREWMFDLLSRCHVFATPFVRGAPDATAFNCGEQNIGYQTFADVVNHTPTEYVLMMNEANQREISNGRRADPEPNAARERSGSSTVDGRVEGSDSLDPAVWSDERDEYGTIPTGEAE